MGSHVWVSGRIVDIKVWNSGERSGLERETGGHQVFGIRPREGSK